MEAMKKVVKGLSEHHVGFTTKMELLRRLRDMGSITVREWTYLKRWVWLNEGLYN